MKATKLFTEFFESEKAAGLVLIACTAVSLMIANSGLGNSYQHIWHADLFSKPLEFWINDGLMTFFFLLVGLEIEREIYVGEFSDIKKAMLPIMAAIGGMLVPGIIHFALNHGTPYQDGVGIPMATDIAFSLGILSLLGSRVPLMLKVFLTALAIIDDLGAILIIAVFYTDSLSWIYLLMSAALFGLMLVLNRLKVDNLWVYLALGVWLWFGLYRTGIHPTITGVLLAFAIPFRDGGTYSPSYRLQHFLHYPVAFIVLPLFALANTAIAVSGDVIGALSQSNNLGIIGGLVLGKPIGIMLFSLLGIGFGWCALPQGIHKKYLLGAGILAGIGFTMSIFITLLAFSDTDTIIHAKVAVLVASLAAGIMGYTFLRMVLPAPQETGSQATGN
jgi:NhaA family Na+:H+ antiporter